MDPTVMVLKTAKALIKKYGWIQGTYGDCEDGYCLIGAIDQACIKNVPDYKPTKRFLNVIHRKLIKLIDQPNAPFWNDTPGRTKEEVLALLDKAIEEYS